MAKNKYIEREGRYAGLKEQKKADVQIVMSGNMPEWAMDHREYWKAADKYERANGRLYKQIEFSLPIELTSDEREKTAQDFAEYLTSKEQLPYTLAIHIDDPQNPHCHLMISERANDGIARSPETWFSRANSKQPEKGGAKKTTSLMPEEWLIDTRATWAEIANKSLERAGSVERIDHRTLAAQGIDREPTAHRGVHGEAKKHHQELQRLEVELAEAKAELIELERREKRKADVQPSVLKVSAEVQFARFDIEAAAPVATTSALWTAEEMSEVWPDVQAPVSAEARGVRVAPVPKPDIEATVGATVAPISDEMASSISKPSKAPEPGVAVKVPLSMVNSTPEVQRDIHSRKATPISIEAARAGSTPKPGEVSKPGAAIEVPAPKVDVQEQMVAASRELKDRILKDETPKPRVTAEVPSSTSSVAPEAQRDVRTQQATPPISNEAAAAAKIAEGIERAKARFAERQAREAAEEKRRQEAEIDLQRKERQALEKRAREAAEEKRRQEAEIDLQRKERQTLEKRAREEEFRKREEEHRKRIDWDREGGWSR
jgi:hypothetical protein